MSQPICPPEDAESSMRFARYLEPSVVSGIELVGTKSSSERLLADWDWIAGLAGLKKNHALHLDPALVDQLDTACLSMQRLKSAVEAIHKQQKHIQCCSCYPLSPYDVSPDCWRDVHHAGIAYTRAVDELLQVCMENPDPRILVSGLKPLLCRFAELLDRLKPPS